MAYKIIIILCLVLSCNCWGDSDNLIKEYGIQTNASVSLGAQCGQLSLKEDFTQALHNVTSLDFVKGSINTFIKATPLLGACLASKSLCAVATNLNTTMHLLANYRLDQCAIIDKAVGDRGQEYASQRANCIGQLKKQGLSNSEAIDQCNKDKLDKFYSLITGEPIEGQYLISDAFEKLGASPSSVRFAKRYLNDIWFSSGGISVASNNLADSSIDSLVFTNKEKTLENLKFAFGQNRTRYDVEEVCQTLQSNGQSLSKENVKKILEIDDHQTRDKILEDLALFLARESLRNEIIKTKNNIVESMGRADFDDKARKIIESKLPKVNHDLEQLGDNNDKQIDKIVSEGNQKYQNLIAKTNTQLYLATKTNRMIEQLFLDEGY